MILKLAGTTKCIAVIEHNNWLYIANDKTNTKYFSIEDIETNLNISLEIIKQNSAVTVH